jgi:DNA-binding beta-propeller fold protein YncE
MRLVAAILLAGASAVALWCAPTPSGVLLVLNKGDHTLAIVDPSTLKVVAKLPAGNDPHEVIASADGRLAFISNYGFGRYNTITVEDLVAQKLSRVIDLGVLRGPHGLTFVGGELYFTAETNKVFGRYNPATGKVDWIMGTGQDRTHMIVVSQDLGSIYTSNVTSGTICIFKKTAPPAHTAVPFGPNWEETVIPTGPGTEGFDVSPDGRDLWAVARQSGTISIIDTTAEKIIQSLPAAAPGGGRLKFTPDGKYVVVSYGAAGGKGGVDIFSVAARRKIQQVDLACSAGGIVMQPDDSRGYVSCSSTDNVAVIGVPGFRLIGRAYAGRGPDGLAWAARR